ncbi:MAG: lysophospholipid acyltransferase family protein [Verrucomicrobiales bacterium]|nr:lysophospholipid acyltransferase family protein [Verrucomicrobiales bacterium]
MLPEQDNRAQPRTGPTGLVVPHAPTVSQRALAWIIYALVHAVAATLRYRLDPQTVRIVANLPHQVIFCVWHNRLALSLIAYRKLANRAPPQHRLAAMVSASRDGGLLAAILELFGVQPVRGSSSRRGKQALLELTSWAERGYDLAITPDGPRGPRYIVQDGVMSLAQVTGLPIVPFSYDLDWKIRPNSWDRFIIPLPFSRCYVRLGDPIYVPRDATEEQREQLRVQLEQTLRSLGSP